ncbi:MAG: hypothetical protein ABI644_11015 [Arenimonas sp.]
MTKSTTEELISSQTFEEEILSPLAAEFSRNSISYALTYCAATDNTALYLDMDGPEKVGRITVWWDGNYHSEALRISDGVTIHSLHDASVSGNAILVAVGNLIRIIADS